MSKNKTSPFKFLDAYEKKDKDLFFGREDEVEELYQMSFQTNLMLVYGLSGTGKTSLLQCGLANRFSETDWYDILIRRQENINDALLRELKTRDKHQEFEADFDLPEMVQSLYLDYLRPIYLIFDQFEELFVLGDKSEQELFVNNLKKLLDADQKCKVIIVMREEYIAHLYDFEKVIPQLFDKRLRVERMGPIDAKEVVEKSTAHFGIKLATEDVAEAILNSVNEGRGLIQLPYLQVFLDRLYRDVDQTKDPIIFDRDLVDSLKGIKDVLVDFLEEQLDAFSIEEIGEKEEGLRFLKAFVSDKGTKIPMARLDIEAKLKGFSANQVNEYLNFFSNRRILRPLENDQYELTHDSLAARLANAQIAAVPFPGIPDSFADSDKVFPGFLPYQETMARSYFGRESEVRDLFDKIVNDHRSAVTLVYGPLGSGKTSLLKAGLMPRLQGQFDVKYFSIDRDWIVNSALPSLSKQKHIQPQEVLRLLNVSHSKANKPRLLILDQFEELMLWVNELSERKNIYAHFADILQQGFADHLMVVLRDDFFAHLNSLQAYIPNLFLTQHRIDFVKEEQAAYILQKCAAQKGIILEGDAVLKKAVEKVKDSNGNINLSVIQLFLTKLDQLVLR